MRSSRFLPRRPRRQVPPSRLEEGREEKAWVKKLCRAVGQASGGGHFRREILLMQTPHPALPHRRLLGKCEPRVSGTSSIQGCARGVATRSPRAQSLLALNSPLKPPPTPSALLNFAGRLPADLGTCSYSRYLPHLSFRERPLGGTCFCMCFAPCAPAHFSARRIPSLS